MTLLAVVQLLVSEAPGSFCGFMIKSILSPHTHQCWQQWVIWLSFRAIIRHPHNPNNRNPQAAHNTCDSLLKGPPLQGVPPVHNTARAARCHSHNKAQLHDLKAQLLLSLSLPALWQARPPSSSSSIPLLDSTLLHPAGAGEPPAPAPPPAAAAQRRRHSWS